MYTDRVASTRNPASNRRNRYAALLVLAIGISAHLTACVRYSSVSHGTGQLAYYGDTTFGRRVGIWVYFDSSGAIQREFTSPSGANLTRTGFYVNGVKMRELTEAEFQTGLEEARKLAKMTGSQLLREDPR
jgi:hypothetical protein